MSLTQEVKLTGLVVDSEDIVVVVHIHHKRNIRLHLDAVDLLLLVVHTVGHTQPCNY